MFKTVIKNNLIIKLFLVCLLLVESVLAMQEKILIDEDFTTNKNNWELFNDNISSTTFSHDKYFIENRTNSPTLVTKKFNNIKDDNFQIETTVSHQFSMSNHDNFGLVFGAKNIGNAYFFGISDKQKYIVYKTVEGKKITLVNFKKFKKKKKIY